MTIQERLAANQERAGKIKALLDSADARAWTADEEQTYNGLCQEYDTEQAALETESRKAELGNRRALLDANATRTYGLPTGTATVPAGGARERSAAIDENTLNAGIRGWAAGPRATAADREAAQRCGLSLDSNEINLRLFNEQPRTREDLARQSRAMNPLDGSAGGFIVAPIFQQSFEAAMLDYDTLRNVAQVVRTDTGANMFWPTGNDTGNAGEWLAVGSSVTNQDMTVAGQQWGAHTISSRSVKVDRTLLQDSAFNLPQMIGSALGERIGRGMAAAHTTGNGVGQPTGIVTSAYLGKTAASSTQVTFDEIMDLTGAVGTAYAGRASFMMHRLVKIAIRKLKDGQGRYLWEPSTQVGMPDSILGYPVLENSNMASALTTGAKIMLFGDLSYYKIRDVAGVTIQRLVEKYAETNQDAFIAFARTDGMLLDAGTHPVQYLALA